MGSTSFEFDFSMPTATTGRIEVANATIFERGKPLAELLCEDDLSDILAKTARLIDLLRSMGNNGFRVISCQGLAPGSPSYISIEGHEEVDERYIDYAAALAEAYRLLTKRLWYNAPES